MTTSGRISLTLALVAGGILLSATPSAAADPMMTTSSPSVAVGGTVDVTVDQCENSELNGGDDVNPDEYPHVFLVTGSGSSAVRAAIGVRTAQNQYRITVPGWVDPADPAVIAGACDQHYFGAAGGKHWRRLFSYPDVPVDVTPPGGSVPSISYSTSRSQAAGGQVIRVNGQGCAAGDIAHLDLDPGVDLAWRNGPATNFAFEEVSGIAADDGSFQLDLVLNDPGSPYTDGQEDSGGPLDEGPYVLRVSCGSEADRYGISSNPEGAPQIIEVVGTNPVGSLDINWSADHPGMLAITGQGCGSGQTVNLAWGVYPTTDRFGSAEVSTNADGTWDHLMDPPPLRPPNAQFSIDIEGTCGDPVGAGFVYVNRAFYGQPVALVDVRDVAPVSGEVRAGDEVTVLVAGDCGGEVGAVLYDADGVVARSNLAPLVDSPDPADPPIFGTATVTLTAPPTSGTYQLAATCGDQPGPPHDYVVTASDEAVPAVPVSGNPDFTG